MEKINAKYVVLRTSWQYYDDDSENGYSDEVLLIAEKEETGKYSGMGQFFDCNTGCHHEMTYLDFLDDTNIENEIMAYSNDYSEIVKMYDNLVKEEINAGIED